MNIKQVYYMFSFHVFCLQFSLLIITRIVLGYLVCVGGHTLAFCLSHFPHSLLSLIFARTWVCNDHVVRCVFVEAISK